MPILTERIEWRRPRPPRPYDRANTLTVAEEANVRKALRYLRERLGGYAPLARLMGINATTLKLALTQRKTRPTAGYALRAAKVARVPVESILAGEWPLPRMCPRCGHVTETP